MLRVEVFSKTSGCETGSLIIFSVLFGLLKSEAHMGAVELLRS